MKLSNSVSRPLPLWATKTHGPANGREAGLWALLMMDVVSLEYGSKCYTWGDCAVACFFFFPINFYFSSVRGTDKEQDLVQCTKSPVVFPDRQRQLGSFGVVTALHERCRLVYGDVVHGEMQSGIWGHWRQAGLNPNPTLTTFYLCNFG